LRKRPDDIADGLVSFANRYGGKMIIGVHDSGELDGKYGSPKEVDEDKGRIDNICVQNCSPPIEYTTEILEYKDGDVLVVDVKRRRGPPHAVIKKKGGEIRERTYYARTSHGKRLLTDSQLDWMFKNPGDFVDKRQFRAVVAYNNENYGLQSFDNVPNPPIAHDFFMGYFIQEHLEEVKAVTNPKEEYESISPLFLNLLPYSILVRIGWSNVHTWNPNTENPDHRKGVNFSLEDIEDVTENRFDFITEGVKDEKFFNPWQMFVPNGLKIKISGDGKYNSELKFYIEDFLELKISIRGGSWESAIPAEHPVSAILNQTYRRVNADSKIRNSRYVISIDSWMDIFNVNYRNYDDYQVWMKRIGDIVESWYSWDKFLSSIPDGILYRIDWNLKTLIDALDSKSNKSRL